MLTLLWEWELPLFIDPYFFLGSADWLSDGFLIHMASRSAGWSFELGPKVSFRKKGG